MTAATISPATSPYICPAEGCHTDADVLAHLEAKLAAQRSLMANDRRELNRLRKLLGAR
jgi:hypothetical protein